MMTAISIERKQGKIEKRSFLVHHGNLQKETLQVSYLPSYPPTYLPTYPDIAGLLLHIPEK